ncbi:TetR family transcriptional regulator [Gracilibacillus sp. S3-1-1]|uniref:TetR family transcriptional regulator n=1 Tax=Gracilibacillus pellucidus TaxID=3095368 RepID=A0ACC6M0Q5_9BACI|nr:TetR family transcriptional regulator [Gracilibacillus sp. S3-1-1]MDX8044476.1 TetR family transcriptional regulator [Gracilibacillus sp. S3-1-1]
MPNATFFNLPSGKKEKLLNALYQEFSTVPLTKASIANIIEYAEIPRGSFYQYFVDKEDAYFYVFNQQTSLAMEKFLYILKKNKGNLFNACIEFYRILIEEKEHFTFFHHSLLHMDHRMEDALLSIFASDEHLYHFQRIAQQIDFSSLKIETDEELFPLMQLISAVTIRNMINKFSKEISLEEALQKYESQLQFVKHGVLK